MKLFNDIMPYFDEFIDLRYLGNALLMSLLKN